MNINRHNYEVFVIDYFDGKLDPVQTAELLYFLSQNPDLEYEFNAFENVNLSADKLKFSSKDELKKSYGDIPKITDSNFEEFCVAEIEGDLDEKSQVRLYQYLDKHPQKYREFELYKKTKLTPDKSVIFPDLNHLKKHQLVPSGMVRKIVYSGIAAAVLLIVFLTFIFRRIPESELITITIPASEAAIKTDDDIILPAEADEISINIIAGSEDSKSKTTQHNKMIPIVNDVSLLSVRDDVEAINQILKPIEIRKIDYAYHSSDIALKSKNQQFQYHAEPPVRTDKSLAEFIKDKLLNTEIAKSAENINVWTLAQASLKGINYLTESDIQMNRKLNTNGEISEISIDSESFGFSTPFKK